jgi:hypothetical protein
VPEVDLLAPDVILVLGRVAVVIDVADLVMAGADYGAPPLTLSYVFFLKAMFRGQFFHSTVVGLLPQRSMRCIDGMPRGQSPCWARSR